jgi:predicted RNA-binding protein with EMAP domain
MTDNEIIKALEYCKDCSANLNFEIINLITLKNAKLLELTDIINHQKAEIERLEQNLKEAHIDIKEHQAHIANLKMLIDKIEDHINPLPFETDYDKAIKTAKAEAVKEFAERLKTQSRKMQSSDFSGEFWDRAVLVEDIDNLVKEMAGAESG